MKNLSQSLNFSSEETIKKVISNFPKEMIEVNGFNIKFDDMSPQLFDNLKEIGIDGSQYLVKCPPDFTITVKLLDGNRFSLKVKEWTTFPTVNGDKEVIILTIEINELLIDFYKHLVPDSTTQDILTAEITGSFTKEQFRDNYSLVIDGKIYDFNGVIG